ncbi:hypothetical protein [Pseudoalteromonas luteoviolacea]|uniref:Uncharacterized protein n=1 Tax=Pseudoalteromonas luteoviolacea NCIMB 1942 TaxID=1365253 RepID=A0A167FW91_9GAMM|nr:hypothetical protein [Pseudoalteromonas luteoviolacea]KZN53295.1 hypothetical protein N482_24970 [Pseudoalteromonas luteoviolacea NCIMB 1942]
MSGIVESISNFFTPGLEQSKKAQIKVVAKGDGTFTVPMASFRKSNEVQKQIRYLTQEKKEGA